MSDNFHNAGINEFLESLEQDNIKIKTDFITISGNVNLDTISSNDTTFTNQLAGSTSSGLKTLIEGNDTDISGINDKLDGTTSSGLKTLIDNKVGMVLGTSAGTALEGNTTTISGAQASKITANENAINAIELKTDHISVTQAVDLDTMESNITSLNTMLQKTGNDTVLKTTGTKIQFYQGDSQLFNSNEVKNLTDNVLISSSVDINTLDTDITGIKNNSLASTLKTAVDNNSAKVGITTTQANNITTNNAKVGITTTQANNITTNNAKVGITTTQANNITTNNSKVSTQWSNNGSEVYIAQNVGIRTSDPNSDLEIGDGTTNVRMRLNGQNSQTNSSEIIFTDNRSGTNPEYYMGASIRFNSSNNRLEFLTDEGNDGTAEPAMFIYRAATPFIQVTHIFADDSSVQTCNLRPLSVYCYGRRVNSLTDTDNDITLSTAGVDVVYRNILSNGIVYNTSTGVFTVPTTALYEITASVQIDCGAGAESIINIILKDAANSNLLKARGHVSKAESNVNTATQLNMIGMIRLESGTDYNFVVASKNTGTGTIQNDIATCNTLMIKGVILQNDTTVPTDWGEAA